MRISEEVIENLKKEYFNMLKGLKFMFLDCRPRFRIYGYRTASRHAESLFGTIRLLSESLNRDEEALKAAHEVIEAQKKKIKDLEIIILNKTI